MSDENKIKDIYILSKKKNKAILNLIKIKRKKNDKEEKQIFFGENEKEINKKYKKKNISILKYYIEKEKNIKIYLEIYLLKKIEKK